MRVAPHSVEAEQNLLSCCLLDGKDVLARCEEAGVIPERQPFYVEANNIIFRRLWVMWKAGMEIDVAILAEEMKSHTIASSSEIEVCQGYAYLTKITSRIPTTAQAGYFIEKVRELAILRALLRSTNEVAEQCYSFDSGIEDFIDRVEAKIMAVTQSRAPDGAKTAPPLVKQAMNILGGMILRKGHMSGVPSGFKDLDSLTWGFQPSDMIVLAARPSMGKTSLALNIAEHIVAPERDLLKEEIQNSVLIFSLEMTGAALMQRMICSRARVNPKLLREGFLSRNGDESNRMNEAADDLSRASLFIDDATLVTVSHIRGRARRIHSRTPLKMVIVDYLQLIAPANDRTPREQQVAEASRGLKSLAKELNVPVLVLSQLNRSVESDQRRPRLSDLRESGAIEQDADVVLLLSKPNDSDDKLQTAGDTVEAILAKQRNGPVGDLKLTFLRDITRFENFHQ